MTSPPMRVFLDDAHNPFLRPDALSELPEVVQECLVRVYEHLKTHGNPRIMGVVCPNEQGYMTYVGPIDRVRPRWEAQGLPPLPVLDASTPAWSPTASLLALVITKADIPASWGWTYDAMVTFMFIERDFYVSSQGATA